MLSLPTVTLLCVDCVDVARAGAAIDRCLAHASFGAVKLLTSLSTTRGDAVAIPPICSLEEYSAFTLRAAYRCVDTPHALIVQHDGYVTHPEAWTDDFLAYDYIGAPWMNGSVGNGGFSLRSRALMSHVAGIIDRAVVAYVNEDEVISLGLRAELEGKGFRFAPTSVAARFSVELNDSLNPGKTFGFHGKHRMVAA